LDLQWIDAGAETPAPRTRSRARRSLLRARAAMVLTHCPAADRIVAGSPCTVPRAEWAPSDWQVPHYQPSMPHLGHAQLERVCTGVRLHVVRPEWLQLSNRARWEVHPVRKYALPPPGNGTSRAEARARCVAALSSFRPRVCSRRDVFVWGQSKRLYSPTHGTVVMHGGDASHEALARIRQQMSPRDNALRSSQPWACKSANGTRPVDGNTSVFGQCGGHAVIGRNMMGVGYFHTVFESLGSLAFLLEMARKADRHGGAVRVLDNMCIPAVGGQNKPAMEFRTCPHGPSPGFVKGFFDFLGINASQLQHYPWVRQREGPPTFLNRATFDCSQAPVRHFWHALKLRSELHARFTTPDPQRDVVVLVDRSSCKGGPFCKKSRGVRRQKEIEAAVAARLSSLPGVTLQVFQGEKWSIAEQAKLFRRAAAMVGPHGAGEVNLLFLQPRTPVIEYVVMHEKGPVSNSALYVGYSHAFNLPYWAVVSNSTDGSYDGIQPVDVADTVVRAVQGDPEYSVLADWSTYVTLGYGDDPRTPPNWGTDAYLHQGKVWM